MTSKCHTIEDINSKLNFFGYRGEAIASVINVSGTTEICSRHKLSQQTFSRIFHNGKAMPVTVSKCHRPSVGTTVSIHDFFYNLPVRRRGISVALELEQVKRTVESIALVNPSISFSVRDDATGECVLQTHKTNSVLARFGLLFGMDKITGVKDVSLSQLGCELSGFISIDGHHNKSLQFIYVNGRIIKKTPLHRCINNMLSNSLVTRKPSRVSESSWQGKDQELGTELIGHRRTQDLFGVYMLNIKCPRSEYDICLEPAKTLIEFKDWDGILSAIEIFIKDFLVKNSLTLGPIIPSGLMLDCQDSTSPSIDDQTEMSTLVPESTADLTLEPLLQSRVVKRSHKPATSLYSKLRPVYNFSASEGTEGKHPSTPPANIPKSITEAKATHKDYTTEVEHGSDMHATIDREQSLRENLPVCYSAKDQKPRALPSDHSESGYQSQGDNDQTFLSLTGTEFLSDQCNNELDKHSTSESCCMIDIGTGSLHSNVTNTAPYVMSVEPCFHSSSSFIKPYSKFSKNTSHSGSGHQIQTLYTHMSKLPATLMVDSNNRSIVSVENSLIHEQALTPNTSYRSPLQSSSISSKLSKLFKSTRRKNGLTSHSKTPSIRRSQAERQHPPPTSLTSHHSTAFQHERSTSIVRTENLDPDSVRSKLPCHRHDDRLLSLVPLTSSVVYMCTGTSNYLSSPEHSEDSMQPILTSGLDIQHHIHTPTGTSSPSITQTLPLGGRSPSNVIYPTCVSTETSVNTSQVQYASVSSTVSCQSLCFALDTSHEGDLDPGVSNAKGDQLLKQISNSIPLQDLCSTRRSQLEDVKDHYNLSNSSFIDEVNVTRSDPSYMQIPHEHIGYSSRAVSIPEPTSSAATGSQEQIWKQVVDPATGKVLYMHSKSGNCVSSLPYDSTVNREVDSFASLFNKDTLDSNVVNSVLLTDSSSALGSTVNSSTLTDVDFPRGASVVHPYTKFADDHLQPSTCCSSNDDGSNTSLSGTSSILRTSSLLSTYKPQLGLIDTKWRYNSESNNMSSAHHSDMIAGRSFSDIFKGWKNPSFHGGDEVSQSC